MTEREELEYIQLLEQQAKDDAIDHLWSFCNIIAPDFYTPDRTHLIELCNELQRFVEGKLKKANGKKYTKLRIEMPPRFGKSRTLTLLSAWLLGKNHQEKIITASHNDDLAQDFSRHTRDIISEEKNLEEQIVYSDLFDAQVKKGDASYKKWALEGQFFNYKGCGVGGSITGRGGSLLIIDDPVKDAETAYNDYALEKIFLWYSGTFLSRAEEGSLQILCMTPWSKNDLGARLEKEEPGEWHVISMPVIDNNGEMLCSALMSRETYDERIKVADENIFSANYLLKRLDVKGRLYAGFNTYTSKPEAHKKASYTDTADEGNDFLCSIHADVTDGIAYVTDIIYTQEPQEITEPLTVDTIRRAGTKDALIESNNGGRAFARTIIRLCSDANILASVRWFHQSKNKKARILTNASVVQQTVMFPEHWAERWPKFYHDLTNYQKEGKNKHDDAPDALTGFVEHFISKSVNKIEFTL